MMALVTGGASSGKSAYAETLAQSLPGPRYYLATMKPFGAEAERRIARHRELRAGKGFETIECHNGLVHAASSRLAAGLDSCKGTALLECLGNAVANELFADDGQLVDPQVALENVLAGVDALARAFDNLVIVGNEVGADGWRYDEGTEAYIRVLGSAACILAQRCDTVVECVAGQPYPVKGSLLKGYCRS